jgi:alpha-tubulin suppressor-like RCC1 family protein
MMYSNSLRVELANIILGDGTTTDRAIPVQVSDLTNVKAITSGGRHTMALLQNGTVWVWGIDRTKPSNHSPLGYDILLNPVQVPALINVQGIAAGPSNYIALTTTGTILT